MMRHDLTAHCPLKDKSSEPKRLPGWLGVQPVYSNMRAKASYYEINESLSSRRRLNAERGWIVRFPRT